MKKLMILSILILSGFANANVSAPKLCTKQDLQKLKFVWADMERNGFERARIERGIGVNAGDCITPFSLETAAGRRHPMNAPQPSCGVVFTLSYNKTLAAKQAAWILDTVGAKYITREGVSFRLCSKVSTMGPNPGATVHN